MMISFDEPDPPDSWVGAGPNWREFISNRVVTGLAAIELRSPDPERLARRWAEVLGRALDGEGRIALDRGEIRFRGLREGERVEGLCRSIDRERPAAPGRVDAAGGRGGRARLTRLGRAAERGSHMNMKSC